MEIQTFIDNYREAFGERAELPIAFWYSDIPIGTVEKVNGCFFKAMKQVRQGAAVSLSLETIGCGGGKLYTGFTGIPEHVPNFVSMKERYKDTPEMVKEFINDLNIPEASGKYLHFIRIDNLELFDNAEGILFFANPDILSGLTTWCWLDTNREDAVATIFGSGCSAIVSQTIIENRRGGKRTFLGLLDPSVRPHFEADLLSYTIPMSRFTEMYDTMRRSCLFDTHAWGKIKQRI